MDYTVEKTRIGFTYLNVHCGDEESFDVPDGVEEVVSFGNCPNLKKITIPPSVSQIDSDAFVNCPQLIDLIIDENNKDYTAADGILYDNKKVSVMAWYGNGRNQEELMLPEGVKSISCILYCPDVKKITLPASVEHIRICAFRGCPKLQEMVISPKNEKYRAEGGIIYEKNNNEASEWYRYGERDVDLGIPEGVKKITYRTFYQCPSIRSVKLPNTLTVIEAQAFAECKNLIKVEFPESLLEIEHDAFFECEKLQNFQLHEGLTTIGEHAFSRCMEITELNIPNSVKKMEYGVFALCASLKTVTYYGVTFEPHPWPSYSYDNEIDLRELILEKHPQQKKLIYKKFPCMDFFEYLARDNDEDAYGYRKEWVDEDYVLSDGEWEVES